MWKNHPINALRQVGFKKSAVYECVWYRDENIFFYYIDDGIFMGPDSGAINKAIEEVERAGLYI